MEKHEIKLNKNEDFDFGYKVNITRTNKNNAIVVVSGERNQSEGWSAAYDFQKTEDGWLATLRGGTGVDLRGRTELLLRQNSFWFSVKDLTIIFNESLVEQDA